MPVFFPGNPRIAQLDPGGSGAKVLTLYLPVPNREQGATLEWVEKSSNEELYDGSECCRRLGWIPEVVLTWDIYDDVNQMSPYPLGTTNNCQATYAALMAILDTAPGFLSVSPGAGAGGFVVNSVKVSPIGMVGYGFAAGLSVTLRGGTICSTKTLGAF